ncbi:unnamed protein product [Phytophthora lilii]|uniref:Unnamed protein product n=1 Tax=Phytophthora lilii TaxID=2077276 RepID=A0A9W6X4R0_9STRA|nr:unnamed protein product [Phytophthora lilii]
MLRNTAAVRRALFEKLPRSFEDSAVHIVCGDFNLALDPDLDASAEHPNPDPSRRALALWLAQLNVTDPWKLHHPADKVYSGPRPRVNRLDYIFLSDETVTDFIMTQDIQSGKMEVIILHTIFGKATSVIHDLLVHADQKALSRSSDSSTNYFVRDLQHLLTTQRHKGLAAFLDFAKAYDRVNREYLFKVLERQGFGPKFIAWIRLMYKDSKCSLMLNGWAQAPLTPLRGVKMEIHYLLFFLICASFPLDLLRKRQDLGIPIGDGLKTTVAFFADDTVLFSKGKKKVELQKQLKLVDSYCVGSGAKLNQFKSVIMSLNNRCPPPCINPLRSLHRGETVRYLGIPFGNCDTSLGLANDLDRKLTTKLRLWKGRARTLLGRKLIVQTLILSLLWYFTSAMIIPNRFINRWQAMINQFVLYNRIGTGKRGVNVVKIEFALTPKANDGITTPVQSKNAEMGGTAINTKSDVSGDITLTTGDFDHNYGE